MSAEETHDYKNIDSQPRLLIAQGLQDQGCEGATAPGATRLLYSGKYMWPLTYLNNVSPPLLSARIAPWLAILPSSAAALITSTATFLDISRIRVIVGYTRPISRSSGVSKAGRASAAAISMWSLTIPDAAK